MKHLIELSDNQFQIVTDAELKKIKQSGEDFDGFSGIASERELPEFFTIEEFMNILIKLK